MAILGAAALGDALEKYPNDLSKVFEHYDRSLRPVLDEIQTAAIEFGLKMFTPTTEEEIRKRNAKLIGNETS